MNIKQDPQLQVHITIFEERTLSASALFGHAQHVRLLQVVCTHHQHIN